MTLTRPRGREALRMLLVMLAAMVVGLAAPIAPARADFGISEVGGSTTNPDGTRNAQAGGHPDYTFLIRFPTKLDGSETVADGNVRDIETKLPQGLVGNPTAAPACPQAQLASAGFFTNPTCPVGSQVGVAEVTVDLFGGEFPVPFPVYNVEAPQGAPALLGMNVIGVVVGLQPELRPDDFGLTVQSQKVSQGLAITGAKVTIWGAPADPVHDAWRFEYPEGESGSIVMGTPANIPVKAFMSAPTDCQAGSLTTTVRARSWQLPGIWHEKSFDTSFDGEAMSVENCQQVPFEPAFAATPETSRAAAPTGLGVSLRFPQEGFTDPSGLSSGHLKKATVTLPEGMTINPASADGLQACDDRQLGLGTNQPIACPLAAKIGTVEVSTPVLAERLKGGIYLRPQASNDPESGQMFRIAMVLENAERGLLVKLGGSVKANRATGRLVTTFDNNPQLPISTLDFNLKGGARAPLLNPSSCGMKSIDAEFSSWSGKVAVRQATFAVDCSPGLGSFAPTFDAGTVNPLGGAYSPFVASIAKPDANDELNGVKIDLPQGLLANLRGALGSQVGSVAAFAGAGPNPLALPGKAYLEGPYGGAPYSLKVVVPAKAGPFDLGDVTVRQKLFVDPVDAHVTAVSDPIPTIVGGVPVHLQRLDVRVDRPDFTLNPTNCGAKQVLGQLSALGGASVAVSDRFQAASCERLGFKPALKLKVSGGTKRASYTKLRAELKAPPGQANIGKASVALPHSIFLAQEHIRTICTRVQYAAKACPAASVYGWARAFTPLLEQPLEGPVYLRSSSNPLPDLVASLDGQIHIDLAGRIDSVNGGIRTTFEGVPDAPVSKFVISMKGGKKSLLVNSRNLCAGVNRATVKLDGQNGKVHDFRPVVQNSCGKKAKKKRK